MTVTADAKKRVVLPPAKPGERFDVQISSNGKLVLTPLIPDERPNQVKLVRKHGYLVAVSSRPITQEQVRAAMDEFPWALTCWMFRRSWHCYGIRMSITE